jgi:hypothetical protein
MALTSGAMGHLGWVKRSAATPITAVGGSVAALLDPPFYAMSPDQ